MLYHPKMSPQVTEGHPFKMQTSKEMSPVSQFLKESKPNFGGHLLQFAKLYPVLKI